MTHKLTEELRQALNEQGGIPLTIEDEQTQTQYVLISLDQYEQMKRVVYNDGDPREHYAAFYEAAKDDIDAPGMEVYDSLDSSPEK